MNIFRAYKRTRFFLWINIVGLAVGLASSTILLLFVINELSYDKDIKDSDRIVSLNTVTEREGSADRLPIATRRALTDVPTKVPGIEAVTQIYRLGAQDLKCGDENFLDVPTLMTEPSFCDVFNLEFLAGNKDVLNNPSSLLVSEKYAKNFFGSAQTAIDKNIKIGDQTYSIGGVVKDLPTNTHFQIGIVLPMDEQTKSYPSIEFFTFYKIKKEVSMDATRAAIEKEYSAMISEFLKGYASKSYGETEKLTDIYLKTQANGTLDKKSSMGFVWMLSAISVFILLLAIINFVNLFIAQGETRILEIGVRKTNGATTIDIAKQFFAEIFGVVFIAFVVGFGLLVLCVPYFAKLISRDIDLVQLYNPLFIAATIFLFVFTVFLSASYPTLYLARFKTLDILAKRIRFSKRRLTALSITFQAIVSIVIISFILVVNNQTNYLRQLPLGYNPKNVLEIKMSGDIHKEYNAIAQELEKRNGIAQVSVANHTFGGGASGQGISLPGASNQMPISEYRINTGICEMMELQLVEGTFYQKDGANNDNTIIVNESAVKALGLHYPVVGTTVDYKGLKEIRGVVKDFYYGKIENPIEPMVLRYIGVWGNLYVKYGDNTSRSDVEKTIHEVLSKFDSAYILNPIWLEDVYNAKFDNLNVQSRLMMIASVLAIFISMIGLLAIHMLSTMRRRKEIGVRRVNGASSMQIFTILSTRILKWILLAGVVAIPLVYYFATDWLNNYANHIALDFWVFALPIFIQGIIALAVTSGVSIKALSENPIKSLKTE